MGSINHRQVLLANPETWIKPRRMSQSHLSPSHRPAVAVSVTLLASLAALCVVIAMDIARDGSLEGMMHEGSGLETFSMMMYTVAITAFFLEIPRNDWLRLLHIPAIMAIFMMRELDFDKRFTTIGIFKSRLYSTDTPLAELIPGVLVAILILYLLFRLVRHGWRPLWRGLAHSRMWAVFTAGAIIVTLSSKTFDGAARKLAGIGITIFDPLAFGLTVAEEVLEALIPILIIAAIIALCRLPKTGTP